MFLKLAKVQLNHLLLLLLTRRYMVIETRKDGTKFTNRALKDAAERQADVSARYEQLQKDLVQQVRIALARCLAKELWCAE